MYTVGYRGGELKVYLLFEHKSPPEPWTALQLLRYVVSGGKQYRKVPTGAAASTSLPAGALYKSAARY